MKNLISKIIAVCFVFVVFACNVEGEERLDYYKNQHRSPELMGWWRQINDINNPENPEYLNFTNFKLFFHYYSVHTNKYNETFNYWYNDADKIFMLDAPSPIGGVDEDSHNYYLNDTKDTLTYYLVNPPYIYVKSQGL